MSPSTRRATFSRFPRPQTRLRALPKVAAQVLALAACAAASAPLEASAQTARPQVAAPTLQGPQTTAPSTESVDAVAWPSEARVSLELKRAPLSAFLAALTAQSGLRFRLATIPDVEVSVSLQNAPLQQAVRDVLALHGFDLRPGPSAFWLVAAPPATPHAPRPTRQGRGQAQSDAVGREGASGRNAPKVSEAWRWWTGAQPPARWMAPTEDGQIAYDGVPNSSGVPGLAPFGVRVRLQPASVPLSRWRGGAQKFQAATPGVEPVPATVAPAAPQSNSEAARAADNTRWCARWPLSLRSVPARCLLVIESQRPASLYVNGSRLLHAWKGRRTVDVSGALLPGANLLALEWLPVKDSDAAPRGEQAAPPVVRYEWIVAQ